MHKCLQTAYKMPYNVDLVLLEVQNALLSDRNHKGVFQFFLDLSAAFDTVNPFNLTEYLTVCLKIGGTTLLMYAPYP